MTLPCKRGSEVSHPFTELSSDSEGIGILAFSCLEVYLTHIIRTWERCTSRWMQAICTLGSAVRIIGKL